MTPGLVPRPWRCQCKGRSGTEGGVFACASVSLSRPRVAEVSLSHRRDTSLRLVRRSAGPSRPGPSGLKSVIVTAGALSLGPRVSQATVSDEYE